MAPHKTTGSSQASTTGKNQATLEAPDSGTGDCRYPGPGVNRVNSQAPHTTTGIGQASKIVHRLDDSDASDQSEDPLISVV